MERSIKLFTLTITRWMVVGSMGLSNIVQSAQLVDEGTLKTSALVRVQATWNTKLVEPFGDQNQGHR